MEGAPTKSRPRKARSKKRKAQPKKFSRLHKPQDLSLEAWQVELRRQYGREQKFKLKNVGNQAVFSDFQVVNPQTKGVYRVAIRGSGLGDNFCSCPDFVTNMLGTCKHIEYTLAKIQHQRGGAAAIRSGFQPPHSEIYLRYGAERQVCLRAGSQCPVKLTRTMSSYFDSRGILRPEAFGRIEQLLADSAKYDHDLRCFDDVLAFVAEVRDQKRRNERLDKVLPAGFRSLVFDKLLKVPLYEYQREGAIFAARAGRCLIGDEMGLGKTVQAIAAAEIMAGEFGVERVLVVCPTSLKHQWEREIARFAARTVHVVGGLRGRREHDYAVNSFYKIINYDTVHRDLDLIGGWSPDLVILDEAQRIKNWNTRTARSVKQIKSPYAIVLTGTPLENRLEELVSIIQFVDRHRLGPTFRFLANHQIHDAESGRVIGYKDLDSIGKTLAPILLRRRKGQVLEQLPQRLDKNLFVPMTDQQMNHHEENKEIVARLVAKWRQVRFLSEADQRRLMIALQNMRMSCDSTYLLDHETDFGVKADELATLLDEICEQPDAKVVIFSQWLRMHELLGRRLEKRRWEHVLFHGGIPGNRRKLLVDRFREDAGCRAFLATDAGGVGLNLQTASVVVNVDLPWNPAVLEQRIGRVHRLGQRRPVRVVNFISQGTIEEGMLSVLKFKKSLFTGALDGGDKEVFLGGSRLSRFMETVEKTTTSIPHPAAQDPLEEPENDAGSSVPVPAPGAAALKAGIPSAAGGAAEPWSGLLQMGLKFLEQLAAGTNGASTKQTASPSGLSLIHRDPQTGERYLKIPAPEPEVLDRIANTIEVFIKRLIN